MTIEALQDARVQRVLDYFFELCRHPRRSGNEAAAVDYLESWARAEGFAVARDAAGNLAIECLASPSFGASDPCTPVVLQAHVDMVCISEDPEANVDALVVSPYLEDGFLRARDTTLGADNGIGVAIAQYLACRPRRRPLRLVFTVDEEETMTGARSLDPSWLDAPFLVNLDSSFSDVLTVGAAGSCEVLVTKKACPCPGREGLRGFEIQVDGLAGGHSGDDIDKGRSNAARIVLDVFERVAQEGASWQVASFDVAGASNAIAARARACGNIDSPEVLQRACADAAAAVRAACADDGAARVECREVSSFAVCVEEGEACIDLLRALPEGVLAASADATCPAALSSNTGTVALSPAGLQAACLVRFEDAARRAACLAAFDAAATRFGASLDIGAESVPWVARAASPLADAYERAYREVAGVAPERIVIHSAVECGELQLHNPTIDIVSVSPDILDAHAVSERVDIASVGKILDVLELLLDSDWI